MVGLIGMLAGTMMLLGGGCSAIQKDAPGTVSNDISPSEMRIRIENTMRSRGGGDTDKTTFTISSLGSFKITYPKHWSATEIAHNTGFMFKGNTDKEFLTMIKQPKRQGGEGATATVGGGSVGGGVRTVVIDGVTYPVGQGRAENGVEIQTVYIPVNETEELFVYGSIPPEEFTELLESISFTPEESIPTVNTTIDPGENCINVLSKLGGSEAVSCY